MSKYIISFDQGTTSSRAIIFNKLGEIIGVSQKEFTQYFPKNGWVEHDPNEIWSTQIGVAAEVITKSKVSIHDIATIGITNQRETTIIWDKNTGEPIYNAIVWQDRRTNSYCDKLIAEGKLKLIQEKTGLIIDAYFSASKIKWILDNIPGARTRAVKGELCFGTVDTWLVWKLTSGQQHITDVSNASRTMLYNIHTLQWDDELLSLFEIPIEILPKVMSSSEIYGYTTQLLTAAKIPISGIAGDQQSALFGQMCISQGMVKNTYGTGCFMLMNTGSKPIISHHQLLTTIAWKIGNEVTYALEGSVFIGGAVIQWLRDGLQLIRNSSEIEELASKVDNSDGVYIVPAFVGLGTPYWNQYAKGMICGITRGTNSSHIARASLESIAYQTMDVLTAMQKDSNIQLTELRVDGGASVNDFLMQFQSDICNTNVIKPEVTETTALGVAYLAGLAVGYWHDIDSIAIQWQIQKSYQPTINSDQRHKLKSGWHQAIKGVIAITE